MRDSSPQRAHLRSSRTAGAAFSDTVADSGDAGPRGLLTGRDRRTARRKPEAGARGVSAGEWASRESGHARRADTPASWRIAATSRVDHLPDPRGRRRGPVHADDPLGPDGAVEAREARLPERARSDRRAFPRKPATAAAVEHGRGILAAGEQILVPNVEPFELPQPATLAARADAASAARANEARAARSGPAGRGRRAEPTADHRRRRFTIAVTKSTSALTVEDAAAACCFTRR